jgi:hypothetical protein
MNMATLAPHTSRLADNDRFYFGLALAMAAVLVAGFGLNFAMGRSTFAVPMVWHLHAVVFSTWIGIFLAQTWFATRGPIALHRRLGWIASFWAVLMVVMGIAITVATIRRGTAPFFFQPQHFLIANPLGILSFAGLTFAAVRLRRQTDWHRRLQICAFATLMGPGFGRLLPSPLFMPYAFDVSVLVGLLFLVPPMIRDQRRTGRVHPAWWWGIGTVCATLILAHVVARSPIGDAIYAGAVAGSPGAALPGMAFGPLPPGL